MLLVLVALLVFSPTSYAVSGEKIYNVILRAPGFRESVRRGLSIRSDEGRSKFKSAAKRNHKRILGKVKKETPPIIEFSELATGFTASLTSEQVSKLKMDSEVLFVEEDKLNYLTTPRSLDFLGLNNAPDGIWKKTTGSDRVVGIIDTGIWPESESFADAGFGPIPANFKGSCSTGSDSTFKCNKKLVGAKFFGTGYAASRGVPLLNATASCGDFNSARDIHGHGTHVAGTSAGSIVPYVINNGIDMGSPRGAAFGARLVAYKVFWCGGGAYSSDITNAINSGVADGVDVLSLSLGGGPDYRGADSGSMFYFSYLASLQGVSVVFAAGNDGSLGSFSVSNAVPWVLTVAASTLDRGGTASKLVLGNGTEASGLSPLTNGGTPGFFLRTLHPLLDASTAFLSNKASAEICASGSLNPTSVSGKVVLCLRSSLSMTEVVNTVAAAGGVGTIIYNTISQGNSLSTPGTSYPSISISHTQGLVVKEYISASTEPKAYLLNYPSSGPSVTEAPSMAGFSSAGPNGGSFSIIKPDIAAPGVNIFAAVTQHKGRAPWTFMSGTSMATPHASGMVALLRSLYPTWVPSMYFSALMTTASVLTNRNRPISATPFKMGAGNINPNAAADPGLVYPIYGSDYQTFFCSPDSGRRYSECRALSSPATRAVDLNLPSVAFYAAPVNNKTSTVRTLRNVGPASSYFVTVVNPLGAQLRVTPRRLSFSRNQTLSYSVSVVPAAPSAGVGGATLTNATSTSTVQATLYWTFGSITWVNNKGHSVRINVALNAI